jgi:flagellar assembly factor FliW
MIVSTTRFGDVDIPEEQMVNVPDGLLGFEGVQEYCLIPYAQDSPFTWLQAVTEPALAFIVINPFTFFSDYDFDISDGDVERLEFSSIQDVAVLSIVTIRQNDVTANLVGPIIVNRRNRLAKQIVLSDSRYTTRHSIAGVASK